MLQNKGARAWRRHGQPEDGPGRTIWMPHFGRELDCRRQVRVLFWEAHDGVEEAALAAWREEKALSAQSGWRKQVKRRDGPSEPCHSKTQSEV